MRFPIIKREETQDETIARLKTEYLIYYRQLPIQRLAAKYINRNEDTILIWRKQDPEFSELVNRAKSEWARDNARYVKNREWLLERIFRDEFAPPKQTVVTIDPQEEITKIVNIVKDAVSGLAPANTPSTDNGEDILQGQER